MAPRGKKKGGSSPRKQLNIQQFMSPKVKNESPRKRKAKEEVDEVELVEEVVTVEENAERPPPTRSPRKKARRVAEGANNNNNNNNEKEAEPATNNNNNNNNEKPPTPEKKKSGGRGRGNATAAMRQTRGARALAAKEEKEKDIVTLEDEEVEEEEDVKDFEAEKEVEGEEDTPSVTQVPGNEEHEEEEEDDEDHSTVGMIGPDPVPIDSPGEDSRDGTDFTPPYTPINGTAKILHTTPPLPKEEKNRFKCKECDQWFPNRYFQRKHTLMEHENQLYECRVCNFNSVNPEKLKSHIIKQHVIKKERSEPVSLDELKVDLDELITKHTPRKVMMEDGVALGRDASNKMRYICAMCDRIYTSKYSLERHVRCHTGEKPYVCDVCNFSTSYREHMMRHMTSVHLIVHSDEPRQKYIPKNRRKTEEKNVSTEEDPLTLDEVEKDDDEEKNSENGESAEAEPSAVDEPSASTDVVSPAPSKKRRNILRKRFECAACGLKATHKTDLVNHIKEKHPNAHIESLDNGDGSKVHLIVTMSKKPTPSRRMVITCPDCSKVFHDTWKYKVHMRSHTGVKPFGCNMCSFFATSKMTVRDHIHRKHKGADNPRILLRTVGIDGTVSHVELNMPEREFKCDRCGEVFEDNYHMKHHKKKAHTDVAPFSCKECGHREWARANIIIHCLQSHKDISIENMILRNEKPFNVGPLKLPKCQQCDKVFPYQSQLYIHMKQHTGERNYFCDICSYRTNSKVALEKHILKHLEGENKKPPPPTRKKNPKKKVSNSEDVINFVDINNLQEDGENTSAEKDSGKK